MTELLKPSDLFLVGSTASGKSNFSLQLADQFSFQIVNCDSLQFFKELKIGTAFPKEEDFKRAPHSLFGVAEVHEPFSAGEFVRRFQNLCFSNHAKKSFLIVGGSGFYIRALETGMQDIETMTEEMKHKISFLEDLSPLKEPVPKKAEKEYKEIMNQVEILRSEIIKRAENRADKILSDAKKESEEILNQARSNSNLVKEQGDLAEILKTIESKKSDLEKINLEFLQTKEALNTLDQKKSEYRELVDTLIAKQNEVKDYESKVSSARSAFSEAEKNYKDLNQQFESVKSEKNKFHDEISKLEKERSILNSDLETKKKLISEVENQRSALQSEISTLAEKRKEVADLSFELSKILDQTNTKKKELEAVTKSIESANLDFTKLKEEASLLSDELKNKQNE